jgi:hypothetical protein
LRYKVLASCCSQGNPATGDDLARILVDQDEPASLAVLKHATQERIERAAVRPSSDERTQKYSSPGLTQLDTKWGLVRHGFISPGHRLVISLAP